MDGFLWRIDIVVIVSLIVKIKCESVKFGDHATVDESGDGKSGVHSFKAPDLSDEEAHSQHMPTALKCDGCLAVSYQLSVGFSKAEGVKSKKLTESQIFDVTDEVCGKSGFEHYGLKQVDGKKRISGPGIPAYKSPGIIQGGGKWPVRLQGMCNNLLEEMGEEEMYNAFRADRTLSQTLCYGKGPFGLCSTGSKDEL